MRRLIALAGGGDALAATLDLPEGPARVGVLIVSGGNELRGGAHRGMAMLAAELASAGLAVLRFDRAGVGDSAGVNGGFPASLPDIAAAARALREESRVAAILGVGNCDAAAALALFGRHSGVDAVVLTNPWLRDEADALPPPAAIRARYAQRLRDPASWRRLLAGGIDLRRLARGVAKILRPHRRDDLATRILDGIAAWGGDASVVLAEGDATAVAFAAAAAGRFRTVRVATASHSFAGDAARAALRAAILADAERLARGKKAA